MKNENSAQKSAETAVTDLAFCSLIIAVSGHLRITDNAHAEYLETDFYSFALDQSL